MLRPPRSLTATRACVSVAVVFMVAAAGVAAQSGLPVRDLREELRIVSNEADSLMLLTSVSDMTVLADGRIVTLHGQERLLRIFAPDGRLMRTVGRRGQGPGELMMPLSVGYFGDTIWVRDIRQRRYQLFGPRFEPAGAVIMPGTGGFYLGPTSGTTSLYHTEQSDSARIEIYEGERVLHRIDIPLRIAGHRFEVRDRIIDPSGFGVSGTGLRTLMSPMLVVTHVMLAPGGREAIVLESAELWGGKPGQFSIRRIQTATGRVSAPVIVTLAPRKVTAAQSEAAISAMAQRTARIADQIRERARTPEYHPAFGSYAAGADGSVWVTDGVPETWLVIDRDGTPVMRVRVPAGLRLSHLDRTHVWGTMRDADDLPIILRYRIGAP